jgi:uncharacterized membrane protein YhaH (DUF805 family)
MISHWKYAVLGKYADFTGRANRPEFWWTYLMNSIVGWALVLLASATKSPLFVILYVVWFLAMFIPLLAVGVRRLHDTGRSGAWVLIAFVPIVGTILLIVFLATSGDIGANQYGTPPPALAA